MLLFSRAISIIGSALGSNRVMLNSEILESWAYADNAFCKSKNAASISCSQLYSMVILAFPTLQDEETETTPSCLATWASITLIYCFSISSGGLSPAFISMYSRGFVSLGNRSVPSFS